MNWKITVYLSYGIPLVLLAIFCLALLGKGAKFRGSPFYKLVQTSIVIDLICYLNTWIDKLLCSPYATMVLWPVYKVSPNLFMVHTFLGHLFFHLQSGCFVVFCLFRYSVIKYTEASRLWLTYYPLVFLALLAISSLATIPFSLINGLNVISFNNITGQQTRDVSGWQDFVHFMYIESILYMIIIGAIWQRTSSLVHGLLSPSSPSLKGFNCQMAKILACDLTIHFSVLTWEVLTHAGMIQLEWRMTTLFGVSDLMSLSRPVLLFVLDAHVKETIGGWRQRLRNKVQQVFVVNNQSTWQVHTNFIN